MIGTYKYGLSMHYKATYIFKIFFIIILFNNAFFQTITPVLKFDNAGPGGAGFTVSPAAYCKNGESAIVSASYWTVYAVHCDTGDTLWSVNTYPDGTAELEPGRFESGIVMAENFYNPGDVIFIVGGEYTQISMWDIQGNLLRETHVDLPTGRGVPMVGVVKFSPSDPWNVVVGLPSTNMGRYPNTWILDAYLIEIWKRPVANSQEGANSLGVFGKNIGFGDLNNNGILEMVVPSDDFSVAVWDQNGDQYGVSDVFYNANNYWSNVIFSRDAQYEFRGWAGSQHDYKPFFAHGIATVIPIPNHDPAVAVTGLYTLDGTNRYHSLFLLHPNRERFVDPSLNADWTLSYEGCSNYQHAGDLSIRNGVPVAYADLTGDGNPEMIFPCTDGHVHAVGLNKAAPYLSWPLDLGGITTRFRKASEPTIFQLPNFCPTIVFTTYGQGSESPTYTGELYIVDCQGQILHQIGLPSGNGNSGSTSGVTLFRKEGSNNNLFGAINTISAGVVVYEFEGTSEAVILWESERGSMMRNGNPPPTTPFTFVKPVDVMLIRGLISLGVGGGSIIILCLIIIGTISGILIISLIIKPKMNVVNITKKNSKKSKAKKQKKKKNKK